MRALVIVGLVLILVGVVGLVVRGVTFHHQEEVARIGDLTASTDKQNHVYFPPYASAFAIVVGGLLVVAGRRRT
jgi:hypothetical protein